MRLVHFTAIAGISSGVIMLMVVARAKMLAVLLEQEGVGLLAHLNNLEALISTLVSASIGYGVTNMVARQLGAERPL